MSKIRVDNFKGEVPKLSARSLPDNYAQIAQGTKLVSTDLEAWSDLKQDVTLGKASPINTIHPMTSAFWLHWTSSELASIATNVDAVLGPIPGDTTKRTYFTGTTLGPRVTNLFYATDPSNQGANPAGAYPYVSFPLGVIAPASPVTVVQEVSPTSPTLITKTYNGSDISEWTSSGGWSVDATQGNPLPSFFGQIYRGHITLSKNFGLTSDLASFKVEMDFRKTFDDATAHSNIFIGLFDDSAALTGPRFHILRDNFTSTTTVTYYDGTGSSYPMTVFNPSILTHLIVTGTYNNTTKYFDIVATFSQAAITVSTISQRMKQIGSTFTQALQAHRSSSQSQGSIHTFFDNLYFEFTPVAIPAALEYTNYVYTYFSAFNEESAPSPPLAAQITAPNEEIVNKVTIPAVPGGQTVTKVYLYRAATGGDGETAYFYVGQINPPYPNVPAFTDNIPTSSLGEEITSTDYSLPLSTMQGLLALPNGILAGFSGNQLCLSAQNQPHAWPIGNRLTTNTQIVGLGAIDTTVLILTEDHPYTAYGTTPSDFSMSKEEFTAGCQSKRSIAFLRGVGILYSTPDGIAAYAGQGRLDVVTKNFFTKEQWLDLNPASIIGKVHDDRYFFWYQKLSGVKGGYVLDLGTNGFGLIQLDHHVTSVATNNLTDTLYFTIDQGDAYDGVTLSVPAGNKIVIWNAATQLQPYQWKSKKYQLPNPTTFQACQIKASDYTSLVLKLYSAGTLYLTKTITSEIEFVLPAPSIQTNTFEFELTGTSRVNTIEVAEDMEELQ